MGVFGDRIRRWNRDAIARAELTYQEAASGLRALIIFGPDMRVKTGFLRSSLVISTSSMPRVDPAADNADERMYPKPEQTHPILSTLRLGGKVYGGFVASYAPAREFGTGGLPPDGFVRNSTAQWQKLVRRAAAKVRRV